MREREEKRVADADANVLFERIRQKHDTLTFKESVAILNDFSYLVVPVDQGKAEFRQLMGKIRTSLQADDSLASQHNFELVEALCRMRIDSMSTLMRETIRNKKLSRSAKDIAVQMLYFARLLHGHQQPGDCEIVAQLLLELKFIQTLDLQAEHINYLMEAFKIISEAVESTKFKGDPEMTKMITEFLPRMLETSANELYRSMVSDVITLVQGYECLWAKGILPKEEFSQVHVHCEVYLDNYLDKTKRTMNGKQFADLLKQIGEAKFHGVHIYHEKILQKLEVDFVSFQAENSHFSVTDLLNMLVAFDRVSSVNNMQRLLDTVIAQLPSAIKSSDADMLALFRIFERMQLLSMEKYEHLCHFVQDYAGARFEFMDKPLVLEFAQFLLKIGLWQWDQHLMGPIEAHFRTNYVEYEVGAMCCMVKLIGNNFVRSEEFLSLIEDSVRMRLNYMVKNEKPTEDFITIESIRHLTEGLSALGDGSRKRLFGLLKTMIILAHRSGRPLLTEDPRLLTQVVRLLCDFQIGVGTELHDIIQEAVSAAKFSGLSELSYLALCAAPEESKCISEANKAKLHQQIQEKVEALDGTRRLVPSIQERLALAIPSYTMDQAVAEKRLRETSTNSNLTEVLKEMIGGDVTEANELVCAGKVKASLLVNCANGKRHIVEIAEDELAHYVADGELKQRQKGRLADAIAKENGFNGYSCLSFIELENSSDERYLFELLNQQIQQAQQDQ